ncbi:MAG: hypothetical protein JW829_11460 [Pirellulales bacterium]|nr:hypothetical protein [Pirellulales bacterium]
MPKRALVACLWISLTAILLSGCTSVSGDSWSSRLWPSEKGFAASDHKKTKLDRRSVDSKETKSPVQLASWPVEIPSLWPQSKGGKGSGNASPLAPLSQGMNTLQSGTDTLREGVQQLQAGSARVWNNTLASSAHAWNNTKRLLTPPLLASNTSDNHVSFWQRLFAPNTDSKKPLTTREFLSQDRPAWGR